MTNSDSNIKKTHTDKTYRQSLLAKYQQNLFYYNRSHDSKEFIDLQIKVKQMEKYFDAFGKLNLFFHHNE